LTEPFDLLPDNMLSEQVILPEHRMALGLIHMNGGGLRVCIWDGAKLRHMAPARARRWAAELEEDHDEVFAPVIEALRSLCDRVGEIEATVATNRAAVAAGLAEMPVEGRA
jgi:hypothetical protein